MDRNCYRSPDNAGPNISTKLCFNIIVLAPATEHLFARVGDLGDGVPSDETFELTTTGVYRVVACSNCGRRRTKHRSSSDCPGSTTIISETDQRVRVADLAQRLHTRVGELELINKLYSDRVQQLEISDSTAKQEQELVRQELAQLRADLEAKMVAEAQLREQLDDSHRRENSLKRRLDELEVELDEKTASIAAVTAAAAAAAVAAVAGPAESAAPTTEPLPETQPVSADEGEGRGSPPRKSQAVGRTPGSGRDLKLTNTGVLNESLNRPLGHGFKPKPEFGK
ncbi:unnamed protein product [Parascedosporium putredinis]|uniref:Asd-4/GZF3-like helical region domain-containing protein n=1 Tax=Parascedosporium putredinis TaxID=1442378 RepID=A0A9P1GUX4_9PEZI|nr:unnamed protein product [Parascedosporium putredinis]CAI7987801.1 unnamed protein product [Parascedosporium putredinis]